MTSPLTRREVPRARKMLSRVKHATAFAAKIVATVAAAGCGGAQSPHRSLNAPPPTRTQSSAPAYTGPRTEGTDGARVISFTIASHRIGRRLNEVAVIPAGESKRPRPLLVLLHELVGAPSSTVTEAVLAALARLGPAAPDIVSPYSPAGSYWHDRAGRAPSYLTRGAWGSYVADEVIPRAITLLHADPRRIAIAGNSMGGFGALDIARLHPGVFCAVAAHSPALFGSYSSSTSISSTESAPGNFDNAADFARHDLLRAAATSPNLYGTAEVWIDAGNRDHHVAADRTLVHLLRTHGTHVQLHVWPGEHDNAYWNLHQEDYFHFYEIALEHCRM